MGISAATRLTTTTISSTFLIFLTGCVSQHPVISDSQVEQNIGASCSNWENLAQKAAFPDAATIARHDGLIARARKFDQQAQAAAGNAAERQQEIEKATQAKVDADAVYDWKYDLDVARSCWDGLNLVREIHAEHRAKLARMAEEFSAARAPAAAQTQPIQNFASAPSPAAAALERAATTNSQPAHKKTWMDTPYAPMIPPVFRSDPVDCGHAAIPPVARDCQ